MENQNFEENNKEEEIQEYCSQCMRQCPKDQLLCERGRSCFGIENQEESGYRAGLADESEQFGERRRGMDSGAGHAHCHERHHPIDRRGGHACRNEGWDGKEQTLSQLLYRCGIIVGRSDGRHRGQGRTLHILGHHPEMSQKELQEALQIEAGSLSEIIGKLEAKGMLERRRDENDRRRMLVQLTEAGREVITESRKEEPEDDGMFQALSAKEQQELRGLLEKLLNQWKEDYAGIGFGSGGNGRGKHGRCEQAGNGGRRRGQRKNFQNPQE